MLPQCGSCIFRKVCKVTAIEDFACCLLRPFQTPLITPTTQKDSLRASNILPTVKKSSKKKYIAIEHDFRNDEDPIIRINKATNPNKTFNYTNTPLGAKRNFSTQPQSFYMRNLPKKLVPFNSERGRTLLSSSLTSQYFALAEQFITQSAPPSCGPATLAMVLNSLKLDPGRVWDGPWRWYTEDMLLSCSHPDESVGISMQKFALLAECNGVNAQTFYAGNNSTMFRGILSEMFSNKNNDCGRLVVCYDRKVLGQTGTGHYSPIGAYNEENDMVLVLDVARFKYPPYWVDAEQLWEAMCSIDPETNQSRGFFVVSSSIEVCCKNKHCAVSIPDRQVQDLFNPNDKSMIHMAGHFVHEIREQFSNFTHSNMAMLQSQRESALCNYIADQISQDMTMSMLIKRREQYRPIDVILKSLPQWAPEIASLMIDSPNLQ